MTRERDFAVSDAPDMQVVHVHSSRKATQRGADFLHVEMARCGLHQHVHGIA